MSTTAEDAADLAGRLARIKALRDSVSVLQQTDDVQFKRIAQIQADVDGIRRAWEKIKVTA